MEFDPEEKMNSLLTRQVIHTGELMTVTHSRGRRVVVPIINTTMNN